MADHELLELAAKAAGINYLPAKFGDIAGLLVYDGGGYEDDVYWNPLLKHGQALRLAVDLGLGVSTRSGAAVAAYGLESFTREPFGAKGDPYAATCRAIVRAAAEIGKRS